MLLLHGAVAYNDIAEKMIMTRTLSTIACKREGKTEILA